MIFTIVDCILVGSLCLILSVVNLGHKTNTGVYCSTYKMIEHIYKSMAFFINLALIAVAMFAINTYTVTRDYTICNRIVDAKSGIEYYDVGEGWQRDYDLRDLVSNTKALPIPYSLVRCVTTKKVMNISFHSVDYKWRKLPHDEKNNNKAL